MVPTYKPPIGNPNSAQNHKHELSQPKDNNNKKKRWKEGELK